MWLVVCRSSTRWHSCFHLYLLQAVPAAARAEALARISQGSGLVLVCTDAAARGLDVPDVTHVVQVGDFGTASAADDTSSLH